MKTLKNKLSLYKYSVNALKLVWDTSHSMVFILTIFTLLAGLLPAASAYLGKLIIDSVVDTISNYSDQKLNIIWYFLIIEALILILLEGSRKVINICQSLLRVMLGQKVNVLILEKALKLDISHFENSEFYDKMTRARREASVKPLSLVNRILNFIQGVLSLIAYGGLLISFSFTGVILLIIASVPSFIAETKFANQAFRLFNWRAPEAREQMYLETLIAREDYAKEIKLYNLGEVMLERYKSIFDKIFSEDKNLTIKRGVWSFLLGTFSSITFYSIYAWIVWETVKGKISLGDMTMYLTVFRQGQSTLSATLSSVGGMYEDNLYLSNLYDFLDEPVQNSNGENKKGITPTGLEFINVSFTYPGNSTPALKNISFNIKTGEKIALVGGNGSGKTTLIKLLSRLYVPDSGKILLDGVDLKDWDLKELHKRVGVIFQDFVKYQFTVGENIGVGDYSNIKDEKLWEVSAKKGLANEFIEKLENSYNTQLGTWFKGGKELSGGQWQKIALSRSFMRNEADILILDEPTSAMDAEAELKVFEHFRNNTESKMVILISHRFSTVRIADRIIVIQDGSIIENGSHQELMQLNGRYAELFTLQAESYK